MTVHPFKAPHSLFCMLQATTLKAQHSIRLISCLLRGISIANLSFILSSCSNAGVNSGCRGVNHPEQCFLFVCFVFSRQETAKLTCSFSEVWFPDCRVCECKSQRISESWCFIENTAPAHCCVSLHGKHKCVKTCHQLFDFDCDWHCT